jgi:hypothetical protein
MSDALAVGLRFADQRGETLAERYGLTPCGPRVAKSKLRPSVLFFSGLVCI